MQTIGVVGLGRMGGSMARRLLESGFHVIGYDVSDGAVATLEDAGGEGRASPASVGTDAAVVVTSLPSPEAVETAIAGEDGVLAGGGGTTVLEASTSDPDTTIALAEVAAEAGVTVVDAPVSGGPGPAAEGGLTFMIGAEAGALDSLTVEVVEALSAEVHYLGEVGAGHTAKLLNNVMFVGNLLVALEALALGAARGVDQEALFEVVASSSGTSAQFEKRVPRVLNRNFEAGFTVDLTRKDLALDRGQHDPRAVHSRRGAGIRRGGRGRGRQGVRGARRRAGRVGGRDGRDVRGVLRGVRRRRVQPAPDRGRDVPRGD